MDWRAGTLELKRFSRRDFLFHATSYEAAGFVSRKGRNEAKAQSWFGENFTQRAMRRRVLFHAERAKRRRFCFTQRFFFTQRAQRGKGAKMDWRAGTLKLKRFARRDFLFHATSYEAAGFVSRRDFFTQRAQRGSGFVSRKARKEANMIWRKGFPESLISGSCCRRLSSQPGYRIHVFIFDHHHKIHFAGTIIAFPGATNYKTGFYNRAFGYRNT
jgi:hypothetical protein